MPEIIDDGRLLILQGHRDAGDRIAYYSQLTEWGYRYGELALGVVLNNSFPGRSANEFFVNNSNRVLSPNELAALSTELMNADFTARSAQNSSSRSGNELSVEIISDYHGVVFSRFGSNVDAWTPFIGLVAQSDLTAANALWDQLLDNVAIGTGELFIDSLIQAVSGNPFVPLSYVGNLTQAGSEALVSPSNEFGPYSVFNANSGGLIIGGNQNSNLLEGSINSDVIMGFDGNDTFLASLGNDRLYGGDGELLSMSAMFGVGNEPFIDTVDYRGLGGTVVAVISNNAVTVDKGLGRGVDTLVGIESIFGTNQADRFIVESLTSGVQFINGFAPLANQNSQSLQTNNRLSSSDDKANVTVVNAADLNNVMFMTSDAEIEISQALLDAGAQVTYLTDEGQGVVWLETNGVTQMISYSGVFNEPGQTQFFEGLTDGATVGLTETGNVMLDFSGSTEAIDSDVLNAIPLFNLVDEFVGSNLGDDIDLALTGLTDFFGGDAGDAVTGTDDGNMISGGGGDDVLSGALGDDMLIGGAGGDTLDGGVGIDTASYSDADAGVRVGLNGQVTATGDAVGDSFIDVENLTGSAFNDVIYGSSEVNVLSGGDGTDQIRGADGADTLLGGAGDDYLWGDAGADVINGGDGNDWAYYSTSSEGVSIHLINNEGLRGDAEGDTWISIERVYGSRFRDVIVGSNEVIYLRGANGDDVLSGQGGDDFLQGDAGADSLIGGAGRDWAFYTSSTIALTVSLADTSLNTGEAIGDTYNSIENLLGTRFDDTLYGDGNSNIIRGGNGDDMLFGGGANDFLRGDVGNDVLNGGAGNDYADYINSNAAVQINLGAGTATGGHAEGDSFISIERVLGSNFDDQIIGNSANNYLRGAGGDDTMYGVGGVDYMEGGGGADTLDGGLGTDWAYYLNAASGVTANLGDSSQNTGEATGDTYISIESLRGSEFGDVLTGDSGTNYITGEAGNDVLNGGAGNDTLRGDEGADTFVFDVGTFRDRVIDFDDSENDMLDFSDFGFTDVNDALSNAANVNGDVVFTIGSDVITIEDTTITEITDNLII